eukprot:jgi/Phyca11/119984/e_gw1.40.311.1
MHTAEALVCNAGTYFDGTKCSRCPGGTFGVMPGLTSSLCSGLCTAGFFCPEGSTSSREKPCGNTIYYCPAGSAARRRVDSGYYTITFPTNSTDLPMVDSAQGGFGRQIRCEKGYYCVFGIRRVCPAGVFGESTRMTTPECSDLCPKGSYCPEATNVPIPWYYCPVGTKVQLECGSVDLFCPEGSILSPGSSAPTPVDLGYFTVVTSGRRTDETICPPGSYCAGGVQYLCPEGTYGSAPGLASKTCSGKCQDGYVCPPGSSSAQATPCPAGTYSRNGKFCASCSPGYWCEVGSPDPQQHKCGADNKYCPLGSSAAQTVRNGYYATGQQTDTHTAETLCVIRNAPHLPQCPS